MSSPFLPLAFGGWPFVFPHLYPIPAQLNSLRLQAKTLLQAGLPAQQNPPSRPYYPVPGQPPGRSGMQCPHHLPRRSWVSRQPRHSAVAAHSSPRYLAHDCQHSVEHHSYRYITSPSPRMQSAIPATLRPLRCSRKNTTPMATSSRAVATLAISEATLIRHPER